MVGWIVFPSGEWYSAMGIWAYLSVAGNNWCKNLTKLHGVTVSHSLFYEFGLGLKRPKLKSCGYVSYSSKRELLFVVSLGRDQSLRRFKNLMEPCSIFGNSLNGERI